MPNHPDDMTPPPAVCFSCSASVPGEEVETLETNNRGAQVFCEECMENGDYIEFTVDQL